MEPNTSEVRANEPRTYAEFFAVHGIVNPELRKQIHTGLTVNEYREQRGMARHPDSGVGEKPIFAEPV